MSGIRFLVPCLVVVVATVCDSAEAHPWHRHRTTQEPAVETEADDASDEPAAASVPFRLVSAAKPAAASPDIAAAFAPFEKRKAIATRRDDRWFYVESNGIPDHPLMVGIRAWQQQVPLPQKYVGENAWQIPLHPTPAANPQTTKDRFLRGAIAVAVNGIPIFNPLNNRGEDTLAIGELDDFGGHCGRADDYHYHVAPVHLEKVVGKGVPIAYALDGYPIYGFTEPDGSPVRDLDWMGGHEDPKGLYHYHATTSYPYLNGGFRGVVTERDGQVDPQPRAQGVREALPPLKGARIIGFDATGPTSRTLTYEVEGRRGTVDYAVKDDGSATFTFTDPQGRVTTEAYTSRRRGPGGSGPPPGGRDRPPRPEAASPPRRQSAKADALGVTSSAIGPDGKLPVEFTCDGAGISPPIAWKAGPAGTVSYALVLWHEAPEQVKTYWIVHDIPRTVTSLPKGSKSIGVTGLNGKRKAAYDPMCSKGPGAKAYHVTVFALSAAPQLHPGGATREAILAAITDTTLAEGTLTFTYERPAAR
ncbi:MAG: YHYH protein [Pirellulales bacterium]